MVKLKIINGIAPKTFGVFPFSQLHGCKLVNTFSSFPALLCRAFFKRRKHCITVYGPSFFESFGDFRSGLWRVFISLRRAGLFATFACFGNLTQAAPHTFVMDSPPKGVVSALKCLTFAFNSATSHAVMIPLEVVSGPVNLLSAGKTREEFSGSRWGHISDNGMKSVETPLYAMQRVRAIPSQAAAACDSAEGVTTRGVSANDNRLHEPPTRKGRYSLSYTVMYRSADKEPHDNILAETLNINPADVISASQWAIKQAAVSVTINGLEMLQNSGEEQIVDLFDARLDVAEGSLQNLISEGIYSDGTGYSGKEITGLQAMVIASPTSGIVGGIDRGSWSFWQNQTFDFSTDLSASASATNINTAFNTLYARCTRGADVPDLIVVDNTFWGFWTAYLQNNQRFVGDSKMAKLGFVATKYMNADVVLDGGIGGNIPAKTAYFLNTRYIFFRPHRQRNFVPIGDDRMSTNQDAIVRLMGWAGNMTASGLKFQGIMTE